MTITRPKFAQIELANAGQWLERPDYVLQEKLDGRWHVAEIRGNTFAGELMRGGEFVPFDIPVCAGQDLRREPLEFRLGVLRDESRRLGLPHIASGCGVEFLETVLARGGEGIVAKPRDSYFGYGWFKIKKHVTHDCLVMEKHPEKMSVRLRLDDQDAGWLPCRSRYDAIRVGDVVEVRCHSIHPSGRLREARFVRLRGDKGAA